MIAITPLTTAWLLRSFAIFAQRWRKSPPAFPTGNYSFIDLGAGMGRGLLLAAEMPFREVIGVELNPELAAIAAKNLAIWRASGRARCPMRVLTQDATEFEFPGNPCVVFLFNPFGATVLRRLVRRIESSVPRPAGSAGFALCEPRVGKGVGGAFGFREDLPRRHLQVFGRRSGRSRDPVEPAGG